MKYCIGDCLSFNLGHKGYLAGFISSVDRDQYQILLTDYCKPVSPAGNDFKACSVFSMYYNMEGKSFSALEVLVFDPMQVDNTDSVEKVFQMPFTGFMASTGFVEMTYSPDTLLTYFENGLLARSATPSTDFTQEFAFEIKSLSPLQALLDSIPPPNQFPTIKLYQEIEGQIYYWQAYGNSRGPLNLVTHQGKLGETGTFEEHTDKSLDELKDIYHQSILQKKEQGYKEWQEHAQMILQFPATDWGTMEDLDFRNEIDAYLNRYLFWTGNGSTTGGDIGSGTVNLFFETVSPAIAVQTIVAALQEKKVEKPFLIAIETFSESDTESDADVKIKVLYPIDFTGEFCF